MVGLFKTLPALLFATLVAAEFKITSPSADNWWVAKSSNVMSWNCNESPVPTFTILINNTDSTVLQGDLAFIAIQDNTACSINVNPDQVDQPAAPGYMLLVTDTLDTRKVYGTSELFEIKPLGSLYPSQVSSSSSVASGTGSAASPSKTTTSGTFSVHKSSFLGVAGALGLLAAGMLNA